MRRKYGSGECEVLQAGYGQIHRGVKDNSRVIMKRYVPFFALPVAR